MSGTTCKDYIASSVSSALSKQIVRLLCAYSAEQCKDAADSKELLAQAYTESSHCINLHGA
jgi:hypothetical protein